jgi:MoaA/NifB/PqqE/SkfB family radical SAM enzyme
MGLQPTTQILTNLALDHWHIEPSSICTLKCPRCPREEVPESLLNRQLTLKFFKEQIGAEAIQGIRKITFCGNDGDPIYCKELIDIVEWIKAINNNVSIVIITNGSHKTPKWWSDLAGVLDEKDEINWSIDGQDQESNQQYRVNSDWDSIVAGIKAFTKNNSTTYRVWCSIGFSFNEHIISNLIDLAKHFDFDLFQLTKSTKFGSKYPDSYGIFDALEPTSSNLVASGHRFEREFTSLSNRIRYSESLKPVFAQRAEDLMNTDYAGICLIGNKGVFLNSQGEFYPCCWVANRYEHNRDWNELGASRFNLNKKTFTEIQNDEFWSTEFLKFDWFECRYKCTKDKLNDTHHTIEW